VPGCGDSERSNLPSVKELSLIVMGNGLFWVIKLGDDVGVGDLSLDHVTVLTLEIPHSMLNPPFRIKSFI
jgi:hypothetical protein